MPEPRILLLHAYYPEFLEELYRSHPELDDLDFQSQRRKVMGTGFALGDAYAVGLRSAGAVADEVIVNADRMQARWASEHGLNPTGNIHDRRRQIVAAQVKHHSPEVLYVFEWSPLGDAFLREIKPRVRLLVGQMSSPLRPERDYSAYDLMISSWPPLVDHFRSIGISAESLRAAFDPRILDRLDPTLPEHDVTFVGGFADSHGDRIPWLERILEEIPVDVFGYGVEQIDARSPIRTRHCGPVWGLEMYRALQRSRITLHLHARIDIDGVVDTNVAAAMRLYEATGVGTCLVTDRKDNLAEMFEPEQEVVTFASHGECVERIRYYLAHEAKRAAVAAAGQRRTLCDHTYDRRMAELYEILSRHL